MSVDERFKAFKAAYAAGEDPDPLAALGGLEGADRIELTALIDAYLARAPAPAWDAAAFAEYRESRLARRIVEQVQTGDEKLADLRHAAQIKRPDLVAQLADELHAPEARSRIADYYHQLEWGTLDPRPVSNRVYEALSRLLGVSAERVRAAAARAVPPSAAITHARTARLDARFDAAPAAPAPASTEPPDDEPDEIDQLFLGG